MSAARPVAPAASRSAEQIRADIVAQRRELAGSMEKLRARVRELSDWRGQVREHRRELALGAAVAGFALGALLVLRRR